LAGAGSVPSAYSGRRQRGRGPSSATIAGGLGTTDRSVAVWWRSGGGLVAGLAVRLGPVVDMDADDATLCAMLSHSPRACGLPTAGLDVELPWRRSHVNVLVLGSKIPRLPGDHFQYVGPSLAS
jgi:hypothetical protein